MGESFWDMNFGEMLREALKTEVHSSIRRQYLLGVYEMMERHLAEHEDDETLTFLEFLNAYGRP